MFCAICITLSTAEGPFHILRPYFFFFSICFYSRMHKARKLALACVLQTVVFLKMLTKVGGKECRVQLVPLSPAGRPRCGQLFSPILLNPLPTNTNTKQDHS